MQVRAELCHVDTLRCIVRAEAWSGERCIASCLGEAANAEDAEDRALQRLQQKHLPPPPPPAPAAAGRHLRERPARGPGRGAD